MKQKRELINFAASTVFPERLFKKSLIAELVIDIDFGQSELVCYDFQTVCLPFAFHRCELTENLLMTTKT